MLLWDPNQVNTLVVLKGIQGPHPLWLHYKPLVEQALIKMPTNLKTIVQ